MMRAAAFQMLWFLHVFTATTQESVKLILSPWITAECDEQVTINCNASSRLGGLSIKHMEWSQDKMSLCSVDKEGRISYSNFTSDFLCEYGNGQLSLTFKRMLPVVSGRSKHFKCKLHSNQGVSRESTRVDLQECAGTVEPFLNSDGPSCRFNHVHPDGDVHWFHGSRNLSDGSVKQYTTKQVDSEGWLTIHSYLDMENPRGSYNCSLKSTTSGRYIASALFGDEPRPTMFRYSTSNGVRSQAATGIALHILISLAVMK
ncbi:uncharacterized protein LOC115390601 [Salarias fasciatus]|uniref:uncharacterized protein LOC115390601 n=1 Tax=Salarias fasciatus TaxID=181472 RepID=UPI00117650D7|nr:uncharacterized protein LOC115390601 [Salarias fasciatus]